MTSHRAHSCPKLQHPILTYTIDIPLMKYIPSGRKSVLYSVQGTCTASHHAVYLGMYSYANSWAIGSGNSSVDLAYAIESKCTPHCTSFLMITSWLPFTLISCWSSAVVSLPPSSWTMVVVLQAISGRKVGSSSLSKSSDMKCTGLETLFLVRTFAAVDMPPIVTRGYASLDSCFEGAAGIPKRVVNDLRKPRKFGIVADMTDHASMN